MSEYRKKIKRFWTDPRVRRLTLEQRAVFDYAITGLEANSATKISGIYEIHRSSFENYVGLSHEAVNDVLNHFNNDPISSELMEYDFENHIIFVKSFYKHNSHYKSGVSGIIEDFQETFSKAPHFWAEFGQKHREQLAKIYLVSEDKTQRQFLDRLFELPNEINDPDFNKPKFKIKPRSTQNLSERKIAL